MKPLMPLVAGAALVGGFAYWIGRSSNDVAQARPVEAPAPVVAVTEPAPGGTEVTGGWRKKPPR